MVIEFLQHLRHGREQRSQVVHRAQAVHVPQAIRHDFQQVEHLVLGVRLEEVVHPLQSPGRDLGLLGIDTTSSSLLVVVEAGQQVVDAFHQNGRELGRDTRVGFFPGEHRLRVAGDVVHLLQHLGGDPLGQIVRQSPVIDSLVILSLLLKLLAVELSRLILQEG